MRTFVVRLQDARARDAEPGALRGVVDEIATGHRVTFTSGAELLDLLAARQPVSGNHELTEHRT